MQQVAAEEARKREYAKKVSRKPTDKNIPDGVEDVIIGDGVERYRKLREVERRLDAVMMRKKLDIQDSVTRSMRKHRTLRVWLSNTAENQPWQQTNMDTDTFDFDNSQATYKVKIEGRLLEDDNEDADLEEGKSAGKENEVDPYAVDQDGDGPANDAKVPHITKPRQKMSSFFKRITIDFDRAQSLQPDGFTQIEWKKTDKHRPASTSGPPADEADWDCLTFERKGDENINVTINLTRDENPERFRLDKPLADLLDTEEDDRAGVVMGVWNYIKAQGLQEDEETRRIHCDDRLRAVRHIFQDTAASVANVVSGVWPRPTLLPPHPRFHTLSPFSAPANLPSLHHSCR